MLGDRRQPQRVGHARRSLLYEARRQRGTAEPTGRADAWTPFDFVIIGAGPAGEAAALQGARARARRSRSSTGCWFGGSCPHIGCLPSKSLLDGAARHAANPARYDWPDASAARDYMVNRPADAAEPDDSGHVERLARRRRRRLPRQRHDHRARAGSRSATTTSTPRARGHERRRRRRVGRRSGRRSTASTTIPVWTNREATLARELPAQPARPRRRPDRLRAGPGVRPVRRPDDDRPVRAAARADRPSAQLRGHPGGARARRRRRPDRRPGAARAGRGRARTARTSSSSTTARPPRATRSCSRSAASFPLDDLGLEHYGIDTSGPDAVPARRAAADRRRAVGHRRPGRPGAAHPPGATTRASSPSGWRSASRSSPTTAPCRARPTPTPRRRRSG